MADTPAASRPLRVLVVDDEANIRRTLSACLEAEGHAIAAVGNPEDAVSEAARRSFDVAFLDIRLGTASGLDLIPRLLAEAPWMKIIMITAYASFETAVEAVRRGASDYIPKPFTPAQVKLALAKAAELRALEQRVEALKEVLGRSDSEAAFESASPQVQRAYELAKEVASSEATVLLRGESGTGKSVLARAIHAWSPRAARPFCTVSCPSIAPELLESELFGHARGAFTGAVRDTPGRVAASEGGTLLLDEIGDLPLHVQPKLLRLLQEKEYERVGESATRRADVRIVAATGVDLEGAIRDGRFREDLYYRLNVVQITLPPLRERREDILPVAEGYLAFFGRMNHKTLVGFTDEAAAALRDGAWPGNLRELRNAVERAAIFCKGERVGPDLLPGAGAPPPPAIGDRIPLEALEEAHIRRVVASTRSLQEAAEVLGIDQATLWRKRKQYGI
jgi:two-component system, NtrC family, response regulator AlgB